MFNKSKSGDFCPLIKKSCIEAKCKFWTHMAGRDANTGNQVDHFDCAVTWLPVLLIENAAMTRQTAAATESFRNEVVKRQDASAGAFDQRLAGPFVEKLR